jgi:hypothetical protein
MDKAAVTDMIKSASAANGSCTLKFLDPTAKAKSSGKASGKKKKSGTKGSGKDSGKSTGAPAVTAPEDMYNEVSPPASSNAANGDADNAADGFVLSIPSPLGMSFKQDEKGYVVTKVKEGGNAEASGKVKADFRIIEVEGVSVAGIDKAAVTDMIKSASAANGSCTVKFLDPSATKKKKTSTKKSSGGKKKKASTTTDVQINIPLGMGFKEDAGKFIVTKVKEGGNAEASGKVKVDMEIMTVNGKPVKGMEKGAVAALIKASNEVCTVGFKAKKKKKSVKAADSGPKQWNAMHLDKLSALALIKGKPPGSFCMRATERGYATVSIIRPDGTLLQKVIVEESNGFCFKGSGNRFASADKLIAHYASDAQNELPVKLLEVY